MIELSNFVDFLGVLGGLVYAIEKAIFAYLEYTKKIKEEKN